MSGRQEYVLAVAERFWPGDGRVVVSSRSSADRARSATHFLLVPSAADPKLVLPAGSTRAAAAAVRGFGGHGSWAAWGKARLLSGALSLGIGGLLLRDRLTVGAGGEGLDRVLSEALGTDVLLALHVGPPRANRKPVLQVLRPDGTVLGFAKIGVNLLTSRLVLDETAALLTLAEASLPGVQVPKVLHHGPWNDLEVLVQSALPVRRARPAGEAARIAAMRVVARATGPNPDSAAGSAASSTAGSTESSTESSTVDDSSYGPLVRQRISVLPDAVASQQLGAAVDRIAAESVHTPLQWGAWHGDWTPWNCAALGGEVLVWDWERFAVGVPVGFDALHYHLQSGLAGVGRPTVEHARATIQAAPALLEPFNVEAAQARLSARLYLVELATRYLADDQAGAGGRLGRVHEWLLPAQT
jgi:hypothetical protein